MNIALSAYGNRIASLFESSEKFVIIEPPFYNINKSKSIVIQNNSPNELLQLLKNNDVKILICGAISGCVQHFFNARDIEVIPWITGEVVDIIHALGTRRLFSSTFIMPGCRKRGRFRHGSIWKK